MEILFVINLCKEMRNNVIISKMKEIIKNWHNIVNYVNIVLFIYLGTDSNIYNKSVNDFS